MNISELISVLEKSKKHLGDVEVFLDSAKNGENVLVPDDINGGRADILLAEEFVDSEDFGRLFSSNEGILKLG